MTKHITNPRHLAVLTLNRFEENEDFLQEVLDFHLQQNKLSDRDRGLYTELVYGTVRMLKNLDYILGLFSKRPLIKIKTPILNNLRLGVYQILYLDRVPDAAAVDETVKLARLFGHQGVANFTNAILRQVVRMRDKISYPSLETDPVEHIALRYSFPRWIVKLWLERWGIQETVALCKSMNKAPEMHLRVNTLKKTPLELSNYLKQNGIITKPGRYAPDVLQVSPANLVVRDPWLAMGNYYIQDESSALVAHALQVEPGQVVYDLCSAPGGKTTHLAQLMENKGKILAFDLNPTRLKLVEENARRLGVSIIQTQQGDATKNLELPLAPRVLVDAPCSGLGTMQHRPDIRWRKTLAEVKELSGIQRQILSQAAHYVESGGLLVYSTCTLTKMENQDVAEWFIKTYPQFTGSPLPEWFPQSIEEPEWYRTFLPHQHNLDGFFIALFEKD